MDTKREIVLELALAYHCVVLNERCPKDDYPLVKFADEPFPSCLIEIKKNEDAMQDRSKLLSAMKMYAMFAIAMEQGKIKPVPPKPRDPRNLRFYEPENTLGKLLAWIDRHQHRFSKMPTEDIARQAIACGFNERDVTIWRLRQGPPMQQRRIA